MANSSTRVLRSSSSKVAGDPTISGNALNVASVDEGSTSEEQDIDSLLKAATLALSGRAKPLLKTPEEHTGTQAVLIQGNHGVAHLNPEVLLAQNKIQAEAQASEKVCRNLWRNLDIGRDDENNLCVASFTVSS